MKKNLSKIKSGNLLFDILNYMFMIIFCITILYPFWNLLLLSFADIRTSSVLGFSLWNKYWTLDSYIYIFQNDRVLNAYINTIFVTVATTVLTLIMTVLGAYPLSKRDLPGRDLITIFLLIPMFFSGGIIPYYLLIRGLGLYDNVLVLIIPAIFSTGNMIIMRNFLQAQDKSLEESAFIDGATYFDVLVHIVIPLMTPVLATIALWTAVGKWNSWFDAMIFTRGQRILVLQLLVRNMLTSPEVELRDVDAFNRLHNRRIWSNSMKAATIVITIGPIVATYPFLQRYFIKGIMIGSLKG